MTASCTSSCAWCTHPYACMDRLCHHSSPCWSLSTCLQRNFDDRISKRVLAHKIPCTGRANQLVRTELAIHLLSGALSLISSTAFGLGGSDRLTDEISRHDGRSPLDQLPLHVFVVSPESLNLFFVLPTHFFIPSSQLSHLSLQRQQQRGLVNFRHPLTCHASSWYHLLASKTQFSLGPTVSANYSWTG